MMRNETKTKRKRPRGTALYVIAALLLGTVGLMAWYAGELADNLLQTESDVLSSEASSVLTESADAYSSTAEAAASEPAAGAAESVPYETVAEAPAESVAAQVALVWPVTGEILKDFSTGALQYSATLGDMRLHTGVDIAAAADTAVLTAGAGTVTAVDESATWGSCVTVDHGDGILLKYCGLKNIAVAPGQNLAAGEVIGAVGIIPCECADADHLHLEAAVGGEAVSPQDVIGVLP